MKKHIIKTTISALIIILLIISINFTVNNINKYLSLKNEYTRNIKYLNNLPYYKKRLKRLIQQDKQALKKIVPDITPLFLLNECTLMAKKHNISINSYNPLNRSINKNDPYQEISIEISIKSDFFSLIKFINSIEKAKFITQIKNLQIERIEPFSNLIRAKMIISGYTIHEIK